MLKIINKKYISTILLSCLVSYSSVYANENGGLPIGLGQNLASAGAGAAFTGKFGSEPIGALYTNPALASMIGNDVALFAQGIWINQYVDTSNAPAGNRSGRLSARLNKTGAILFGGNYWFDENFAFSLGVAGGMTPTKYKESPTMLSPFPIPNLSPSSVNNVLISRTVLVTPTLAYKESEGQGYAVSAVFGLNEFKSNLFNYTTFQETKGMKRTERVYGGGVRAGGLWTLTDQVGLGVSASSPIKFQKYKKYRDVSKNAPNFPGSLTIGTSFHATETVDILLDVKRIFFHAEKFYKDLKWRDQMVYMLGVQCNCMDDLSVRAGYNYGKSPIRQDGVFINILSPHIVEHHVTAGFMYKVSKDVNLSLIGQHAFAKRLVDNGKGPSGMAGKGAVVKSKGQSSIQVGVIFNF